VDSRKLICASEDLVEQGPGIRFDIDDAGEELPAFAVRYRGEPRAYINRCSHISLQLDFLAGRFFDRSGEYLVCATHGALYDPASGACAGGRCNGIGLETVRVTERRGRVELVDREVVPARESSGDAY
jgi:nitrite reductase/ring-hydroxylating ferredoxin subunit